MCNCFQLNRKMLQQLGQPLLQSKLPKLRYWVRCYTI
ncbi:unnamed protein product [Paramecium octaurelia]|uniref:Uncharacterized protein n=1 Tax=Paramecium octaurelia TaxID=43137 RepID=A0A8S1VCA3_PAROT|nr:unnamed protein product [Paramecium octaurelia]